MLEYRLLVAWAVNAYAQGILAWLHGSKGEINFLFLDCACRVSGNDASHRSLEHANGNPALGERVSALFHRDGRVTATFMYRDVPFRDGRGVVHDLLVGTCDICGDAIVIPAESTPKIAEARRSVE